MAAFPPSFTTVSALVDFFFNFGHGVLVHIDHNEDSVCTPQELSFGLFKTVPQ
jgi:hypothetical protein